MKSSRRQRRVKITFPTKLISLNCSGVALAILIYTREISSAFLSLGQDCHFDVYVCGEEHELIHELRLELIVQHSEAGTHSTDLEGQRHSLNRSFGKGFLIRDKHSDVLTRKAFVKFGSQIIKNALFEQIRVFWDIVSRTGAELFKTNRILYASFSISYMHLFDRSTERMMTSIMLNDKFAKSCVKSATL